MGFDNRATNNLNNPSLSRAANLGNALGGIAEQLLTVRENPALRAVLNKFDNSAPPRNEAQLAALLGAVERAKNTSGFLRSASPDLINDLGGQFSNVAAELGVTGPVSRIGSMVSVRNNYRNIAMEGFVQPAVLPRNPGQNSSIIETLTSMGTSPEALAETITAAADQNSARRALSQIFLGNILQNLNSPDEIAAAGATRKPQIEGMTSDKYNSLRASFADKRVADGTLANPYLYPSNEGLGINTQLLDALSKEISAQTASGTLSAEQVKDLTNLMRLIKVINGVRPGPSQEQLAWRARLESEMNGRPITA